MRPRWPLPRLISVGFPLFEAIAAISDSIEIFFASFCRVWTCLTNYFMRGVPLSSLFVS